MPRTNKETDLNWLQEQADRFDLDDESRESFIKQGMEKLGYKLKTILDFEDPEGAPAENNVSFFGPSRQQSSGQSSQRQQRPASSGGQYRS